MRTSFRLIVACAAMIMGLTSCQKGDPTFPEANLVVYGTIYTADDSATVAQAIAVKDGKFVYVGDEAGVGTYVGDRTIVVDHRGKGMITPAFTDGHAHYMMSNAMTVMGALKFNMDTRHDDIIAAVRDAYLQAKREGKPGIYGFGWEYHYVKDNLPTLAELDAICPDLPLYLSDSEGHKGLANSVCLFRAGIIDERGDLLIREFPGGEIVVDAAGKPTGFLKEQAGTFCRLRGIDFSRLMDAAQAMETVRRTRDSLHANGYVSFIEGWANYYGNLRFYEAARALDRTGDLECCVGLAYEVESSSPKDSLPVEFGKAYATASFATRHINPRYIKMFVDGTVETHTGYVREPYVDAEGGVSAPNWTSDDFAAITADVNAHNYTMHIHAMGDEAVHMAVSGFVRSGRPEMRNTLVHVRNVLAEDFAVMAANNIVVTSGILWHLAGDGVKDMLRHVLPEKYVNEFYPIRSYFDNGVVMSSHSDFPALSGSSEKPLSIMEIGVTGVLTGTTRTPLWPEELVTRPQMLRALTLNGAYQMHNDRERGSIQVGKYADFVLFDRDVMDERTCPAGEIHTGTVLRTYFEGHQVYKK